MNHHNQNELFPSTSSSDSIIDPGLLPHRLLTISILQILADSTPFTSIRPISLSILTHIAARYLQLLANSARSQADHSSRHHINAWDLSGVLENLHGPGTLASLLNWHIDNQHHPLHHPPNPSIQDPIDKLSQIAQNLKHCPPTESEKPPIAILSFLPLTEAELAELDRAGQSDPEDDHPSPIISSSSASSEDDSDPDCLLPQSIIQPIPSLSPIEPSNLTHSKPPSVSFDQDSVDRAASNWRSIDDIPAYVPPYFPPFPGLDRQSDQELSLPIVSEQPVDPPKPSPPPNDHHPSNLSNLNPYSFSIPYSQSQLFELHGSFVEPQPSNDPPLEPPPPSSPARKKARLSESLDGFLQTYGYLVQEKITNPSNDQPRFLKPNPIRHQFISSDQTQPLHDSLFGSIPVGSIRANRWSAGWIPHPPTKDGQLLPIPELKPYGHTPLPLPVAMPVPLQFPPTPLLHQPHPRIPDLIPRWFQKLSQDARDDKFILINRLTRLGPPSQLSPSGEPQAYKIQELNPTPNTDLTTAVNHPSTGDPSTHASTLPLTQPRYIQWGFHWPAHEGKDPLPPPKPTPTPADLILDFKPREFPGMPRTTAEKNRTGRQEHESNANDPGRSQPLPS